MDAAAIMTSRGIQDQVCLTEDGEVWDFRTVEFASPQAALLFFPSETQQKELKDAFDTDGSGIIRPIAEEINSRFSEDYTKLADGLYQEGEYDPAVAEGTEELPMVVALLFYERHIAFVSFEDGKYASEFLLSDDTILPIVDENYLPNELDLLGISRECDQVIYDENQLKAIFEAAGSRPADQAIQAAVVSEDTFRQMAGEMNTGYAYAYNPCVTDQSIADAYKAAHEKGICKP